jgi:hypothetical protein
MRLQRRPLTVSLAGGLLIPTVCCIAACSRRTSPSGRQASDASIDVGPVHAAPDTERDAGGPKRNTDREPPTDEERRKHAEALLEAAKKAIEEFPPSGSEGSKNLRERAAQKLMEQKLTDEAYQQLQRKIRNLVLNMEYRTALRIIEADPGFMKYRDHPQFKRLHDEVEKLLVGEDEGVPNPRMQADADAGSDEGE